MEDYKREQLIHKVNSDMQRAKNIELARQATLMERQRNQIIMQQQKRELVTMFKAMRNTKKLSFVDSQEEGEDNDN